MFNAPPYNGKVKVFYHLVEAGILWSEITDETTKILGVTAGLGGDRAISKLEPWPQVQLCAARIQDALVYSDLPFGRNGAADNDRKLLNDPALTIRHVELRAWMTHFYPGERPSFLFDAVERSIHPEVSVATAQVLMMERDVIQSKLNNCVQVREQLNEEILRLDHAKHQSSSAAAPGPRAEGTYLNIIGGLLDLLLGKSPAGVAYSSFETREAVLSALLAYHGGKPGMSERTLRSKFSAATRHLNAP